MSITSRSSFAKGNNAQQSFTENIDKSDDVFAALERDAEYYTKFPNRWSKIRYVVFVIQVFV